MQLKRLSSLFAAFVGMSCVAASATKEAPAIAAFDQTFAGVTDYTCVLHSHEVNGTKMQDRTYQYSFMKPHYLKTLILSGDGKGSGAVWVGGDQVSGHLGGVLSGIHVKINLQDPRALSLHGVTIPDGLLPGIIDDYGSIPGTLTQSNGGTIGGVATDRLDLRLPTRRRITASPSRSPISRSQRIGRSDRSCFRDHRSCSTNRSTT